MSTPGRPEGEGTPVHAAVQQAPLRPGTAPALQYVLRLGDTCLIHAQRLAEWCGRAPVLEEDIALANIALDHIGQARALLTLAGTLEGRGRDEDTLAFLRSEREYCNVTMLEAACAGIPTVGTLVGHVADWHPDRAVGVPIGDSPALAGAILSLLRDSDRRERIAANARQWALAHDADWTANRFETLYDTVIRA